LSLGILLPCLTILSNAVSILSGFAAGVAFYGMNPTVYWRNTFLYMTDQDILAGMGKSLAFSVIITIVACHLAFRVGGGAEGV
ncbi:ABC transporter permease, partial [Vibrio parahaemolyticus]|uniref:ABC transporter permease n=1 Tax=Vibrio parahaemolyticus TaxID=670 RepID=UPI002111232B